VAVPGITHGASPCDRARERDTTARARPRLRHHITAAGLGEAIGCAVAPYPYGSRAATSATTSASAPAMKGRALLPPLVGEGV